MTGLLWFDNDPNRTLEDKVLQAAARYERKYGQTPNVCFVHHSQRNGAEKFGGVKIRTDRSILLHHFWIGVALQNKETDGHN